MGWVVDDREGLAERYSRAMKINAALRMAECAEIADDGRNDWMEKEGRDGSKFYQLNGEHVRRSEIRLKWRQWYFEQASQGRLSFKKSDEADKGNTAPADILAMLDRIVAGKAATREEAARVDVT